MKTKQTEKAEHGFVENVTNLEIPSAALIPTNSEVIRRPCQIPLDIPLKIITYLMV